MKTKLLKFISISALIVLCFFAFTTPTLVKAQSSQTTASSTNLSSMSLEQLRALVAELTQLLNVLIANQTNTGTPNTTPTEACIYFATDLNLGSEGSEVTRLQNFLESLGYLVMPAGQAKGYYGNVTQVAVARYQSANGISPANGYFNSATRAHISANCGNDNPLTNEKLRIISVTYTPSARNYDESISARVVVKNEGNNTIRGAKVSVQGTTRNIPIIRAGEQKTVTVSNAFSFNVAGTYDLITTIIGSDNNTINIFSNSITTEGSADTESALIKIVDNDGSGRINQLYPGGEFTIHATGFDPRTVALRINVNGTYRWFSSLSTTSNSNQLILRTPPTSASWAGLNPVGKRFVNLGPVIISNNLEIEYFAEKPNSVSNKSIVVTSPNGGETVSGPTNIRWSSTNITSSQRVNIGLITTTPSAWSQSCLESGTVSVPSQNQNARAVLSSCTNLPSSTVSNTGIYVWTPSANIPEGSQYYIYVSESLQNGASDQSDSAFTIKMSSAQPIITLGNTPIYDDTTNTLTVNYSFNLADETMGWIDIQSVDQDGPRIALPFSGRVGSIVLDGTRTTGLGIKSLVDYTRNTGSTSYRYMISIGSTSSSYGNLEITDVIVPPPQPRPRIIVPTPAPTPASFPVSYSLSTNVSGNGTISGNNKLGYTNGELVTLTAIAGSGSTFTGWTGACSGTYKICTVSMNSSKSVTAGFEVSAPTPSITLTQTNTTLKESGDGTLTINYTTSNIPEDTRVTVTLWSDADSNAPRLSYNVWTEYNKGKALFHITSYSDIQANQSTFKSIKNMMDYVKSKGGTLVYKYKIDATGYASAQGTITMQANTVSISLAPTNTLSSSTNLAGVFDAPAIGTKGSFVKSLQQELNAKGFVVNKNQGEAGSIGNETEYFGEMTFRALKSAMIK